MNRPTVPPLKRRGDDPILDALADGRGDRWLLARMERGLRRVSFLPEPAPWASGMSWVRRYARLVLVVSFGILAPGLVALSLFTVTWVRDRLRASEAAYAAEHGGLLPPPPSAPAPSPPLVPAPLPEPSAEIPASTSHPAPSASSPQPEAPRPTSVPKANPPPAQTAPQPESVPSAPRPVSSLPPLVHREETEE